MALVRLARFGKPSETHLARLALERAGIDVELRGEARSVLTGEVPFEDVGGELWVDEADAAHAARVLAEAETAADDGPELECPACRAQNPAGFDVCWKCQSPLDAGPKVASAPPAAPAEPTAPASPDLAKPPGRWLTPSSVAIAALLAVVVVLGTRLARDPPPRESRLWKYSQAEGGCVTETQLDGTTVHAVYCDANGNGIFERVESYDAFGRLSEVAFDSNENGRFERLDGYSSNGERISMNVDRNETGRGWDHREFAGGAQLIYTDADGDEQPDRLELRIDGGATLVQRLTREGWQTQP